MRNLRNLLGHGVLLPWGHQNILLWLWESHFHCQSPMATVSNAAFPPFLLMAPQVLLWPMGPLKPAHVFPTSPVPALLHSFSSSIPPPLRPAFHLGHISMKCNYSKLIFFCSLLKADRTQLSFHGGNLQFYPQEIQGDDLT